MDLKHDLDTWSRSLGPRGFFPNPPLPAEHVARVERRLGRALPPSYRAFLEEADGGTFHRFFVHAEPADLDLLSFAHHDQPTFSGIFDEMRWSREMPVDLLPVAADGSGNLFGFLVPEGPEPAEWPVGRFDQEALTFQPLGSSFRALLRWVCLEQELLLDDIGQLREPSPAERERIDTALHRRMAEFDPGAAWSWKRLGVRAAEEGDLDEAERLLRRAVEARSDYAAAWAWLADVSSRRGDAHGASRAATRALLGRFIPDGPQSAKWVEVRALLQRHGLDESAVPASSPLGRFALGDAPLDRAQPRATLAAALSAEGDLAGAVREMEAALYLAEENEPIGPWFERLERWLRDAGRTLEADLTRRDGNVYLEMSASMSMTIEDLDLFRDP